LKLLKVKYFYVKKNIYKREVEIFKFDVHECLKTIKKKSKFKNILNVF